MAKVASFATGAAEQHGVIAPWNEERQLLAALRAGDRSAADEMVNRTYESVYASLYRMCGDRDTAADLTQETYKKAWTALASFDDGNGAQLYNSGTAQPGINYIARLVSNQWQIVDGGVGQPGGPPWPSTFGLCAWQGKLYIGGDFDYVGTNQLPASGLVARTSCVCPADFNNDGTLDFFDYLDFVSAFSAQSPSADFNGDNVIDFFDYLDFVQALGAGC